MSFPGPTPTIRPARAAHAGCHRQLTRRQLCDDSLQSKVHYPARLAVLIGDCGVRQIALLLASGRRGRRGWRRCTSGCHETIAWSCGGAWRERCAGGAIDDMGAIDGRRRSTRPRGHINKAARTMQGAHPGGCHTAHTRRRRNTAPPANGDGPTGKTDGDPPMSFAPLDAHQEADDG